MTSDGVTANSCYAYRKHTSAASLNGLGTKRRTGAFIYGRRLLLHEQHWQYMAMAVRSNRWLDLSFRFSLGNWGPVT